MPDSPAAPEPAPPGNGRYDAADSTSPHGDALFFGDEDWPRNDDDLLRVGLERTVSAAVDGGPLYDDVRQEIEHVMTAGEARAVARRRAGLPRPPRDMDRAQLLDVVQQLRGELDRLRVEVDQARGLARVSPVAPATAPRRG